MRVYFKGFVEVETSEDEMEVCSDIQGELEKAIENVGCSYREIRVYDWEESETNKTWKDPETEHIKCGMGADSN